MEEKVKYKSPTYYELAAPPELDWRPHRPPSWHTYRTQWDLRGREKIADAFPLHLDIDPTNKCNLACQMCPRTYYLKEGQTAWAPDGRLGDMDFALYEKIISEGADAGLKSIKLNFLGEPLLYPKLVEMVALASQKNLWVMLNTNATLLSEKKAEELLKAGLTDIFFSVDSPYPEIYEKIRVGAKFTEVINNIKNFMAVRERLNLKAVQVRASMVLPEKPGPDDEKTKADYLRLFRGLKIPEIGFGLPSVMGLDYEKTYGLFPGFCCPDLFRRMFIFWDGQVGPCCGDWERELIVGDANISSLTDIWQGEAYQKLRSAHQSGHYEKITTCRKCSVPYLSTV